MSSSSTLVNASPEATVRHDHCNSRIEELIAEQNRLLCRQLELSEENHRHSQGMAFQFKDSRQIITALDPSLRVIFKEWRKRFHAKLNIYVTLGKTLGEYQKAMSASELIKPFAAEARRPWHWSDFYRAIAKPIDGVDPVLENSVPAGMADVNGNVQHKYDIDAAFAALKQKQAQELQDFVVAHHHTALDSLVEELSVAHQSKLLENMLEAFIVEHSRFYTHDTQQLMHQAKNFVQIVYREEMPKAECRIQEEKTLTPIQIIAMRIVCALMLLVSMWCLDHELLARLFGILFALGSGMALIWEELVLQNLQLLFGGLPQFVQLLLGARSHVMSGSIASKSAAAEGVPGAGLKQLTPLAARTGAVMQTPLEYHVVQKVIQGFVADPQMLHTIIESDATLQGLMQQYLKMGEASGVPSHMEETAGVESRIETVQVPAQPCGVPSHMEETAGVESHVETMQVLAQPCD